jgi:hypothetical protein
MENSNLNNNMDSKPQGTGVQFHDDYGRVDRGVRKGGITASVIRASGGLIKNDAQASIFLLIIAILAILLTTILFFKSGSTAPTSGEIPAGQYIPQ